MKKFMGFTTLAIFLVTAYLLYLGVTRDVSSQTEVSEQNKDSVETDPNYSYISADGDTLETRINVPQGYTRTTVSQDSFGAFVRSYAMKSDGSQVCLYDGSTKEDQNGNVAVFDLPLENENLQQCADSVMRMYGEYYYKKGAYSRICYSLGDFQADFETWSQGNTLSFSDDGEDISWTYSSSCDESYESFQKFMRLVFAYSGTMNMEDDSEDILADEMRIGDIFLDSQSPGHVTMVVDVCTNEKGELAYLLAEGGSPAQNFHVISNPLHTDDPWYYLSELSYPLQTPEFTFDYDCLMRYRLNEE